MWKSVLSIVFILIFGSIMYALTLRGVPGNLSPEYINNELKVQAQPFELSPERGRYTLIMSIADYGTFELPEEIALIAMPDVGYLNDNFYTLFAPGVSIITLPLYIIGKQWGLSQVFTFAAPAIMAILNCILVFLLSRKLGAQRWAALAGALVFGFGTISWAYAITLYQHHFTVFFILLSLYSLIHFKKRRYIGYAITWASYGMALTLDSPNPLLLLPIMVYMLVTAISWKKVHNAVSFKFNLSIVFTSIFFFVIAALYGYYNLINFGGWATLSGTMPRYKDVIELADEKTVEQLVEEKTAFTLFDARRLHRGLYTLLFSDDRGLVLFAPVVLIGILGLIAVRKEYANEVAVVIGVAAMSLFLYGSFGDPWGGWSFGPRYLIPLMSLLSVFIGVALSIYKTVWLRFLLIISAMYSSAIALLGVLTTNAVPPKIEAIHLPVPKYNFLLNLEYLQDDKSSSFIYNQFLGQNISLTEYYALLLMIMFLVFTAIIMMIPLFERRQS